MFVNLKCGECDSSMRIDLSRYLSRVEDSGRNVLLNRPSIQCIACGDRFSNDIAARLYEMMFLYLESQTKWKFSFEFKDAKTSTDTP